MVVDTARHSSVMRHSYCLAHSDTSKKQKQQAPTPQSPIPLRRPAQHATHCVNTGRHTDTWS